MPNLGPLTRRTPTTTTLQARRPTPPPDPLRWVQSEVSLRVPEVVEDFSRRHINPPRNPYALATEYAPSMRTPSNSERTFIGGVRVRLLIGNNARVPVTHTSWRDGEWTWIGAVYKDVPERTGAPPQFRVCVNYGGASYLGTTRALAVNSAISALLSQEAHNMYNMVDQYIVEVRQKYGYTPVVMPQSYTFAMKVFDTCKQYGACDLEKARILRVALGANPNTRIGPLRVRLEDPGRGDRLLSANAAGTGVDGGFIATSLYVDLAKVWRDCMFLPAKDQSIETLELRLNDLDPLPLLVRDERRRSGRGLVATTQTPARASSGGAEDDESGDDDGSYDEV